MVAGDRDRDRAAAALREHYAGGRLTLDELGHRTELVLASRSRTDLRRALSGLPMLPDTAELVRRARSAARGALLVVFTGMYVVFTFVLLLALAVTLLVSGVSTAALIVLLVVWLVPTYALSRLWHRPRRPSV